jgi:hypothetical protein
MINLIIFAMPLVSVTIICVYILNEPRYVNIPGTQ